MPATSFDLWLEEETAVRQGYAVIVGIDEAGRGPLAGPVVAGCVQLPLRVEMKGLNDSKKLSPAQRDRLFDMIQTSALAVGVGQCEPDEIDRHNILRATHIAMRRAYEATGLTAQMALIDGLPVPSFPIPQRALVKGDSRSASIAAASIVAKVTRDRIMRRLGEQYPGYGLAENMGYPTPPHLKAVAELGPSPVHRMSFAPVAEAAARLAGHPTVQPALSLAAEADGLAGETIAASHLKRLGYEVVCRNFRVVEGEVDIIARQGNLVVFAEVKTHRKSFAYRPAQRVDGGKQKRLTLAAEQWLVQQSDTDFTCRFDVLEVIFGADGYAKVQHIEDAFRPDCLN